MVVRGMDVRPKSIKNTIMHHHAAGPDGRTYQQFHLASNIIIRELFNTTRIRTE